MKKFVGIGFAVCMLFILFLSGQSGSQAFGMTYHLALPIAGIIYDTPDYDQILVVMNGIRILGRIVVFMFFGGFFTAFVYGWGGRLTQKTKNSISVSGIVLFGIFDETRKLLIDGRHCTLGEIIVNIVCGFIGAVFVLYVFDKNRKK